MEGSRGQSSFETATKAQIRTPPLWVLVLITLTGTLAMHMFIPILPQVAEDLQASMASAQMTLSLYIVGLAVGQLFYGPLSDHLGRRPTLIGGLILYAAAGALAALAPNIGSLLWARVAQSLGGCACLVIGRAIVRDTSPPNQAMRRLALVNLAMVVGPGLAPIVGSLVAASFGWRAVFMVLAGLGTLNILLVVTLLPETSSRRAQDVRSLIQNYKGLLKSKIFLGIVIGGACSTTPMFALIAAAPFAYVNDFHRPAYEVGFYIALTILGVAVGNTLASFFAGRVAMDRLMTSANLFIVVISAILLATMLTGTATTTSTTVLATLYAVGPGLVGPSAMTRALGVNTRVIGSAAGLYGFGQMLVGAICTSLIGVGSDPMVAAALLVTVASVIGQIAFFIVRRR